jgi:ParB family chromosome partitioning protein
VTQHQKAEEDDQGPTYQLVAGERRWQACRLAGVDEVPAIVKEATEQQMLELALVENIQRADLNPLEEARAYQELVEAFGLTQEEVASRVGRNRVSVTNALRLLRLPEQIKEFVAEEQLTEGHARAILGLSQVTDQITLAKMVIDKGLSVRQTEEMVRRLSAEEKPKQAKRTRSPETEALETDFRHALGTKVNLSRSRRGGRLTIYFYSEEELQALYEQIVDTSEQDRR